MPCTSDRHSTPCVARATEGNSSTGPFRTCRRGMTERIPAETKTPAAQKRVSEVEQVSWFVPGRG